MSKKYLSLEEAAQALGISVDDLKQLREKGEIRGFADRATWKFREQDIQEYRRRTNPDSSPEVSIMGDDDVGLADEPVDDDSASDVRLILDDDLLGDDSAPEVPADGGSDSDVQLVDTGEGGSDSDVKLVDTSDPEIGGTGSDSDVRLVEPVGNASDSNVLVGGEDHDEDGLTLAAGSSILGGEDSGISLEAADSGISLEAADSGISLESLDSSINLSNESSAEFTLGDAADSGISLSADDEEDETKRTMAMESLGDEDDLDDTKFEMEAVGSSEYEITGLGEGDDEEEEDTSVLLLDDEDESSGNSATMVGAGEDEFDEEAFDLGEDEADEFDDFDMEAATVAGDDDELDDLDVFDAVDEDFDDGFGDVSQGEFAAPVGMRVPAAVEPEWGTGMFVGVLVSSILMAICGLMMIDLVRSMWSYHGPAPYTSPLLDMFKGMLN